MRDVLQRGLRFGYMKAVGVIGVCRNDPFDPSRFDCARGWMVEHPINQSSGDSTGCEDTCPYEVPAIEVNHWVGYLAGGYFIRFFQRENNGFNNKRKLAEFRKKSIEFRLRWNIGTPH